MTLRSLEAGDAAALLEIHPAPEEIENLGHHRGEMDDEWLLEHVARLARAGHPAAG